MRNLAIISIVGLLVAAAPSAVGQTGALGSAVGLREGAFCYPGHQSANGQRCEPGDFAFPQRIDEVSESNRILLYTHRGETRWVLRTEVNFASASQDGPLGGVAGGVAGGRFGGAGAREAAPSASGGVAPMRVPAPQRSQRTNALSGPTTVETTPISSTPQVPRCTRSLGTISIQNGDSAGWSGFRLQPPAALLRVVVQQSGCFTVVERGAGLDAAMRERELAGGGQLQRGSNVGGGQVRAADYVLLADVIAQDNNASGGGFGAALGGVVGGRLGGVIGGLGARTQTAQTTLTLANVRTTESFSAEGNARNRDWTWGGVGFLGGGGVGLGGYTDTEIGRVITIAFIDAYTNMVIQAGGAPEISGVQMEAYRVTSSASLQSGPGSMLTLRNLPSGAIVYALGDREGLWWRVTDEHGNVGWVSNELLSPAQ